MSLYKPKDVSRFNNTLLRYNYTSYLTHTTTPISLLPGHRQLRAAMTTECDIPRTRTTFGNRAFSVAGPREWNALPADVKNMTDLSSFKRPIKTHLFVFAYSD